MNRKEYMKRYNKRYYDRNSERLKKEHKQYYDRNSRGIMEQKKQYNIENEKKIKEYQKQWRKDNLKYTKQYCRDNSEKLSKHSRQYYQDNREKVNKRINQYTKNKRKINLKFNLNNKIRIMINRSLKGNKNGHHWENLVGYTLDNLIKHLKKTMPKNYTWQDYMEGKLHVDHKIPISVWDFDKSEHVNFKKCWALSNLQLLLAEENLIKHAKLDKPFQMGLKI